MVPDDNTRAYAESTASARKEGNSPALHATEEMRRLATPWSVAVAKAQLISSCELPSGIILDPACGSGTQLAAICSTLNRQGLGVELSGAVAPLAAVNLERCGEYSGGDWLTSSRIIWGNGNDAASIMQAYQHNTNQNPSIALLHVDPARPKDAQHHTLNEMQPCLDELLTSWAPYLGTHPALILDLSPRLLDAQRNEIESIVSSIWGKVAMTWQWLTQGRGRIDRLSLWVGAVAGGNSCRLIRLTKSGDFHLIEGKSNPSLPQPSNIESGDHLVIVDPSLISSGLGETWKAMFTTQGARWERVSGRRPIFISSEDFLSGYSVSEFSDSSLETVRSMIQAAGEVVATIPSLDEASIPELVKIAQDAGVSSLKLRCNLDPSVQPKLQSKIDRQMKTFNFTSSAKSGFIAEVSSGHVICKEYV